LTTDKLETIEKVASKGYDYRFSLATDGLVAEERARNHN
jgi:hypothetical protein